MIRLFFILFLLFSGFLVFKGKAQAFSQYKVLADSAYVNTDTYQKANKYQRDAILFVDMLADTHPYYVKKSRQQELQKKRQTLLDACGICTSDTAFISLLFEVLGELHDKHTDLIDTITLSVKRREAILKPQEQGEVNSNSLMDRHDALFDYNIIEDESICYLQFNQCADGRTMRNDKLPKFDDFLEEMFHTIDSLGIQTLVVDVQYNNGGNSMLCDELLCYLYPLSQLKQYRSYMRFSDLLASYNPRIGVAKQRWEQDGHSEELYPMPTGKIPELNRKVFGGNVVFVQSPKTYSSAGILMTLVRDNGVGPIIGTSSSYSPSHYGEVLPYRLPNTGIIGTICCKYFARPDTTCIDEKSLEPTWKIDTENKDALWYYIQFTYGKKHKTGQNLPVRVDERVEFLESIARIAGYATFNENYAPQYQKEVDSLFSDYKDTIKSFMKEMRRDFSIGYSAVPSLAVNIKWNGSKFIPIKSKSKRMDKRWTSLAIRKILPFITDMYKKTQFHSFFIAHLPKYNAAVKSFSDVVANKIDMDWFSRFFSMNSNVEHSVVVGLNNGLGNFSVEAHPKGKKLQMISVMGYDEKADGTPNNLPHQHSELVLVHEFCHSYIDAPQELQQIGEQLLNKNKKEMREIGYSSWQNVIEETLVRASVIRYMLDHNYPENLINEEIHNQHQFYHFVWMPTESSAYNGDIFQIFKTIK